MNEPLDDVEFLARSKHRVGVLEALREDPRGRRTLQAEVGASRVTVGRILADLEARGWVRKDGRTYALTPLGDLVIADFGRLTETVATAQRLRPAVEWFPTEWLSFDLRALADAEVVVPTRSDPLAPARLSAALMREADHVRIVAESVMSEVLAMQWEAATEREQESTVVMSEGTRDTVAADPTMAGHLRDLLGTGLADVHAYAGDIPASLGIYDDETVGVGLLDESRRPSAVVVSTDESVLAWAEATYASYREAATPLDATAFEG